MLQSSIARTSWSASSGSTNATVLLLPHLHTAPLQLPVHCCLQQCCNHPQAGKLYFKSMDYDKTKPGCSDTVKANCFTTTWVVTRGKRADTVVVPVKDIKNTTDSGRKLLQVSISPGLPCLLLVHCAAASLASDCSIDRQPFRLNSMLIPASHGAVLRLPPQYDPAAVYNRLITSSAVQQAPTPWQHLVLLAGRSSCPGVRSLQVRLYCS